MYFSIKEIKIPTVYFYVTYTFKSIHLLQPYQFLKKCIEKVYQLVLMLFLRK